VAPGHAAVAGDRRRKFQLLIPSRHVKQKGVNRDTPRLPALKRISAKPATEDQVDQNDDYQYLWEPIQQEVCD